jgi:hypothetical protein
LSYSQLICRLRAGVQVIVVNKKDLHLQMAKTQLLEEAAILNCGESWIDGLDRWPG